jgi:adenosylcobinamide-phosphate synthase
MALTVTAALATAAALAALLDRAYAEPPEPVHPVVLLGRTIAPLDREWPAPRVVGLAIAITLPALAAVVAGAFVVGFWVVALAVGLAPGDALAGATLAAGVVLFTTISLRLLLATVDEVVCASESDLALARQRLLALAGRNSSELSAAQIRSAAVESAAENLADGLVAPLLAFAVTGVVTSVIGSAVGGAGVRTLPIALVPGVEALGVDALAPEVGTLALAAGAAMWLKAVNTLDSMLGYRHKPVGWGAARLDDLAMWLPARVCAALLALAGRDPAALWRARASARIPDSPNSGWPMATLAAILGVELSKPGHYALVQGPSLPTVTDATQGVTVVRRAGWLTFVLVVVAVGLAGAIPEAVPGVLP